MNVYPGQNELFQSADVNFTCLKIGVTQARM